MKILMINSTYAPNIIGGAELSVQYLAESLLSAGHEVRVVTAAKHSDVYVVNGVNVQSIKLKNLYWPYGRRRALPLRVAWNLMDIANPLMAHELSKIIKAYAPDVVHTNNLQGFSPAVWSAARSHGVPVVHTLRDLFLLCPKSAMFRNGRNCERQCRSCAMFSAPKRRFSPMVNAVVGINQFILDRHLKLGWFPQADTAVVYNSFPTPAKIERQRISSPLRFGFLGRVDQRKGVESLIDAFRTSDIAASSSLLLTGEGQPEYVATLKGRADGLPVEFSGRLTPGEFFSRIDVLITPSIIHEALGRVILEAYAYGIPVIGSERGGIPEIIEDGKTGFLCDPQSPADIVARMRLFVENPGLAMRMETSCRAAFDRFQPDVIREQYEQVYAAACGYPDTAPQSRTAETIGMGERS